MPGHYPTRVGLPLLKESRLNHLGKLMFQWFYWHALLPGAVGLGVLDSFAFDVPLVTVDLPYHGPEIDYVRDGENGVKLPAQTDADGANRPIYGRDRRC